MLVAAFEEEDEEEEHAPAGQLTDEQQYDSDVEMED